MDAIIEYFAEHTFLDLLSALVVIVAVILCIEKFFKWLYDLFIKLYKKKKGQEEEVSIIDKNTSAIEELSKRIEELGNLVNKQYTHLDKKIDEQKEHLEEIDKDGKARDCAFFRDRLIQATRYFNQRRNDDGIVYLSIVEFENLKNMFTEYFSANGNGAVKQIYEQDFLPNFRIDNVSPDISK